MRLLLLLCCLCAYPGLASGADPEDLGAEVAAGKQRGIDALLLSRDGELLLDAERRRLRWQKVDIRSATKSVTALLVGMAIDRGLIASVEVKVKDLLPELAAAFDDPLRARMRLVDLLTMRSGLDCDDWTPGSPGHEDSMYRTRDWLGFWSRVPMRDPPGTRFSYCTGNVIALGRILANASGKPVPEFAREVLFLPLERDDVRWASWNRGRDTDTGGHLAIAPRGLLAIGQLVLDEGAWQGRQLVSRDWIAAMTKAHAEIPGRSQRYGYLWWIDATRNPALPRTRLLMAWGNGGNFVVVMPELDAVYVTVGRRYNQADNLEPLRWLGERILPGWPSTIE